MHRIELTGAQIRAARALIRLSQQDLANRCGLSVETIKRIERVEGPAQVNLRTLKAIIAAFAAEAVWFDARDDGRVSVGCLPRDLGAAP